MRTLLVKEMTAIPSGIEKGLDDSVEIDQN